MNVHNRTRTIRLTDAPPKMHAREEEEGRNCAELSAKREPDFGTRESIESDMVAVTQALCAFHYLAAYLTRCTCILWKSFAQLKFYYKFLLLVA